MSDVTDGGPATPLDQSAPPLGSPAPPRDALEVDAPGGSRLLTRVLAGLVVVVLLVAATVSGVRLRSSGEREEERDAVMTAARRAAVAFTSYDHASLDASFERLSALSTDDFREQFTAASGQLRPLIVKKQAQAEGQVLAVALGPVRRESRAVVFVAVDATVTNTDVPKGALQRFRLRLTLQRVGGQWRVDEITPVV